MGWKWIGLQLAVDPAGMKEGKRGIYLGSSTNRDSSFAEGDRGLGT